MGRASGSFKAKKEGPRPGGFFAAGLNPQVGYGSSLWLLLGREKGQRPDKFLPADFNPPVTDKH